MESIRINVERPKLVFALDGVDVAQFDFYAYDTAVSKAYADKELNPSLDVVVVMKEWMKENGKLSNDVPYLAVADWMIAVDKSLEEMAKKAIGS